MIRVTVEVAGTVAHRVLIVNRGPVAPDEAWDSGGERVYEVTDQMHDCHVRLTHFRRDGLLPLVVRALEQLT